MKCYRCGERRHAKYLRIGGKDLCIPCYDYVTKSENRRASASPEGSSYEPELPSETTDAMRGDPFDDDDQTA